MAGQNLSKTFVWIILALLIVGLAGFGAINIGGTIRTVGTVGTQVITVDEYFREMQREIRGFEAQTGQPLSMSQASALGLDQRVLSRLVSVASLDNEVAAIGISIGDENLQQEILEIPAFRGINGQFDRETYRFTLNQANMNEIEFEGDIRSETSRTLVQGAILAGVQMPSVMADTMVDFIGARRSFVWAKMDSSDLTAPLVDPADDALQTYYDDNAAQFMLPESKKLSYVLLSPEMILDQVEVDDDAMRALYETLADKYNVPERRLVERLVFGDDSDATSAMAQLEVGGSTFETLVQNRGLSLSDIDLGDVTVDDLGDAAETVFAGKVGDVVGPLPTSLGPALFRINGILAARLTSFEDAAPELRDELASDRARRLIELQAQEIDDLLAAGATLQEVSDETDMQAGQIEWTAANSDGIAAYDAFREAAAAVTDSDFPAIVFLEDGGVFALQLDEVLPTRPEPIADAHDRVLAGWTLKATEDALQEQANALILNLATNGDFAEAGLVAHVENGLTRTAYIDGTPADFMTQVFTMEPGELRIIANSGSVLVVRFTEALPAEKSAELEAIRSSFGREL
ncbi:MAG: peptidyl-prolyl cis-trans isomerase D, partial [Paracoccaceae bacterium]